MYLGSSRDFTIPIGRQTARGGQPVRAGAGLGATEAAGPDCPQPTSTEERDRIRNNLNKFTGNWMGQKPHGIHWHERHPDVKRAIEDIINRMIGITQRPKKLRCSAEMRNRAQRWIGSLDALLRKVKTGGGSYDGKTVVPQTFNWGFYRGPTYTIRSTNDPAIRVAMGLTPLEGATALGPPLTPVVASHPPGSVVVGGEAFASSAEARAAQAAAAAVPAGVPGDAVDLKVDETIAGIPSNYLLYGGLALGAVLLLKRR